MIDSNYRIRWNDIFVIFFVWFSASANLMPSEINRVALYVVLPSAFIMSFSYYRYLLVNKYFNLLTLLYVWVLLSVLWATDTSLAFDQVKKIIGCYILCYIFAVKSLDVKNICWLYITYVILLAFAWYYAYTNIFSIIDLGRERLNDENLNANTLAYYTFYVTFALYILGESTDKYLLKKFFNLLFILTIPLSIVTAIYTASRQVLIIQIPLSLSLLYIRYIKDKSIGVRFLVVIISFICVSVVAPMLNKQYDDSLLKQRAEVEYGDESRIKLAYDAFDVGIKYFPLGVGAGNYVLHSYDKHFSHNVYLELFANVGIVGLVIYLNIIIVFLIRQWKRYRYYMDKVYLSFFIFGIFYFIDGLFYSFYESLWLIGFFLLVASHSEIYYELYHNYCDEE